MIVLASTSELESSSGSDRDNPCRRALRLDRALPTSVFGPVLRLAFCRLASICRFDAIPVPPPLLVPFAERKDPSKRQAHQDNAGQESNNLAAERTGNL